VREIDQLLGDVTDKAYSSARELMEAHLREAPDSPLVGSVSLFRAMGFFRQEVAHTQALAWLLDPSQSHRFGSAVFDALGRSIDCQDIELKKLREKIFANPGDRYRVYAEYWLSPSCRADVLIEGITDDGEPWELVIEAKIGARESPNQLSSIMGLMKTDNCLGVFLTPTGRPGTTQMKEWASLSFESLANSLIHAHSSLRERPGSSFLRLYLTGLLEETCGFRISADSGEVLCNNNPFLIERLLSK
jgi:hypothetical protein|tara:strand:- start:130 stop:870 length:741 start_codon:yes stop_codon:yes gene_type:complete